MSRVATLTLSGPAFDPILERARLEVAVLREVAADLAERCTCSSTSGIATDYLARARRLEAGIAKGERALGEGLTLEMDRRNREREARIAGGAR